jgi:hypothetical protein
MAAPPPRASRLSEASSGILRITTLDGMKGKLGCIHFIV